MPGFAICCNSCEETIPNAHYHCSTCDDGDFDLCQSCVDKGITCHGNDHWLIKRSLSNGQIINSLTEVISPKIKAKKEEAPQYRPMPSRCPAMAQASACGITRKPAPPTLSRPTEAPKFVANRRTRTCNSCVEGLNPLSSYCTATCSVIDTLIDYAEIIFVHCNDCEDYDLCQLCFQKGNHGHHPKHSFAPVVPGTPMPDFVKAKLTAGRNQAHNAICDGCDKVRTATS